MIFSSAPNDWLAHYGIKGQKWGIRRYQNPDGTLTAEGRKRYGFTVKDEDVSRMSFNKKVKMAKKERRRTLVSWHNDLSPSTFSAMREFIDRQKWSNNNDFQQDVKKAFDEYEKIRGNDHNWDVDWNEVISKEEKILNNLKKKYPGASDIIEGFDFEEAHGNPKAIMDKRTYIYDEEEQPIYSSWLTNITNPDYYYEPNDKDWDAYNKIYDKAVSDFDNDMSVKYGQDVVNKILKK